jgi:chromatin remodeling complex protein RSC6
MSSTATQNNKNASSADKKSQKVRKVKKDEPVTEAPAVDKPSTKAAETPAKVEKTEDKAKRAKSKTAPQKEQEGGSSENATAATTEAAPQQQPAAVTAILMDESFERLLRDLDEERTRIKNCINGVRDMRKQFRKLMRDTKKRRREHKGGNANKSPSGFAQPCRISDDLCQFLKVENGTLVPRTTVTKEIIKYIKDNNLQNAENRKKIEPDVTLRKLVGNAEDLTFFNLQVHLNPHFPPKVKKDVPASAPAAA